MAPEVARITTMGNQLTARDHAGTVYGNLTGCFGSEPTKQPVQDDYERYKKRPASVTTNALMAKVKTLEFKQTFMHVVFMTRDWKDDPSMVFKVP